MFGVCGDDIECSGCIMCICLQPDEVPYHEVGWVVKRNERTYPYSWAHNVGSQVVPLNALCFRTNWAGSCMKACCKHDTRTATTARSAVGSCSVVSNRGCVYTSCCSGICILLLIDLQEANCLLAFSSCCLNVWLS
jgi:hypothetical protein